MTMPAQECPTRMTGPSWLAIARLVAATSSARDESGFCTEITCRPLASRRGITFAQLDPSAKAPCTNTTFFTVDSAAAACERWAPAVSAQARQTEYISSASLDRFTVIV